MVCAVSPEDAVRIVREQAAGRNYIPDKKWLKEISRTKKKLQAMQGVLINDIATELGLSPITPSSSFHAWVKKQGYKIFKMRKKGAHGNPSLAVTPKDAVKIYEQRAAEGYGIK